MLDRKAKVAQQTALTFFLEPFEKVKENMSKVVEASKREFPGEVTDKLSSKYEEAIKRKEKIDIERSN